MQNYLYSQLHSWPFIARCNLNLIKHNFIQRHRTTKLCLPMVDVTVVELKSRKQNPLTQQALCPSIGRCQQKWHNYSQGSCISLKPGCPKFTSVICCIITDTRLVWDVHLLHYFIIFCFAPSVTCPSFRAGQVIKVNTKWVFCTHFYTSGVVSRIKLCLRPWPCVMPRIQISHFLLI